MFLWCLRADEVEPAFCFTHVKTHVDFTQARQYQTQHDFCFEARKLAFYKRNNEIIKTIFSKFSGYILWGNV